MPLLVRPCGTSIRYAVRGGDAGRKNLADILLLPPGGMQSTIDCWAGHTYDAWSALSRDGRFRVVTMDQRNACVGVDVDVDVGGEGPSVEQTYPAGCGPIGSGWDTYRDDQLALLDHLGLDRCLILGSCIGPSFALNLMKHSPDRFPAAVFLQPIGLARHTTEPCEAWEGLNEGKRGSFVRWSEAMVATGRASAEELDVLHEAMYGSGRDFVFSVRREDVSAVECPILVYMGKDRSHPSDTSREIAKLARNAELVERWRDEDYNVSTVDERILSFLVRHAVGGNE